MDFSQFLRKVLPHLTFACSKSTIETFKKGVKYAKSYIIDVVLMFLLLTLNIFHTFFSVFIVSFKQVNVSCVIPYWTRLWSEIGQTHRWSGFHLEFCVKEFDRNAILPQLHGRTKNEHFLWCFWRFHESLYGLHVVLRSHEKLSKNISGLFCLN